uniref:Uncharacterized protein n=1 Tax=Meloidogyne enterolobii TaxID=390850 RepID=A0A6V7WEF5_MELEN|nr:unnamed protein product [Meloidogyne enterolobii]
MVDESFCAEISSFLISPHFRSFLFFFPFFILLFKMFSSLRIYSFILMKLSYLVLTTILNHFTRCWNNSFFFKAIHNSFVLLKSRNGIFIIFE